MRKESITIIVKAVPHCEIGIAQGHGMGRAGQIDTVHRVGMSVRMVAPVGPVSLRFVGIVNVSGESHVLLVQLTVVYVPPILQTLRTARI